MGWSLGFDTNWKRDVGYGVPALCDHPDCSEEIDRGLGYICGGEVGGGGHGCGLFFCGAHRAGRHETCERCDAGRGAYAAKPDITEWIEHKLTDESWQAWRDRSPGEVAQLREILAQRCG